MRIHKTRHDYVLRSINLNAILRKVYLPYDFFTRSDSSDTVSPNGNDTFNLVQYHSKLGQLHGTGAVTSRTILLTFQSPDNTYSGFEAVEKIDDCHYHLRSALSLNGMPSSVLEAALRRVNGEG